MALWICQGCTAAYAVGLTRCPQCGSTQHTEEGTTVPKITTGGGPSFEPGRDPRGGEPPSAPSQGTNQPADGGNSSTSGDTANRSSTGGQTPHPGPAPDAENPSDSAPPPIPEAPLSGTAPTTDGSTPATTPAPNASDEPEPAPAPES